MALLDLLRLVVVTGVAGVLRVRLRVAGLAGYFALTAMIQREGVDAQRRRRPGLSRVAIFAFQTEETGVDLRLSVAAHTLGWRSFEALVRMTARASQVGVCPIQREDGCMDEIVHAVAPIMAIHAVCAKLAQMVGHESAVFLPMTGNAGLRARKIGLCCMAGRAWHCLTGEIHHVKRQTESGGFVVERLSIHFGRLPGLGGMAILAGIGKHAGVLRRFSVAGSALYRGINEFTVRMAIDAL